MIAKLVIKLTKNSSKVINLNSQFCTWAGSIESCPGNDRHKWKKLRINSRINYHAKRIVADTLGRFPEKSDYTLEVLS